MTAVQYRLLRTIALRTKSIGYPPTTRELMTVLGYRSTNAIAELLGRLEDAGFINRGHGARALTLTPKGLSALEVRRLA